MRSSKYAIVLAAVLAILMAFAISRLSKFGPSNEDEIREKMVAEIVKLNTHKEIVIDPPDDDREYGEAYIESQGWKHGYMVAKCPYWIHFYTDSGDEYYLGNFQFKLDKKSK